ncbi:AMP-binding protein [Archangium violaceum]|uniref:AMP-binding protein n=1 Tax=Archangium violaceum TaxID=83451 RepID=UPI00194E4689|nr:AMP-binding protein [Archangium violaceum]QRO00999.1 AMP-binding protein [Archangium violaceum]
MSSISSRPLSAQREALVDVLRTWSDAQPDARAYTFLLDGEGEEVHLSYGQLDRNARTIANALRARLPVGGRALLVYPPGLEFIAAFYGCLYAGVVAVPVFPPMPGKSPEALERVAADSGSAVALTTTLIRDFAEPLLDSSEVLKKLEWLSTDDLPDSSASWQRPELERRSVAFLQYTSGSTRAPKGVRVTHENLMVQEDFIQKAFEHDEKTVVVGWLPLYHDMGLIGNVLQPMYLGGHCVLMSPFDFLGSPLRWLEAISRYRATTSGGPNFAYELCVRRYQPERAAALDLSSWKVAYNGAEPLRAATLERFARTYAPHGFREGAFLPCYGLAEATLAVSAGRPVFASFDRRALERREALAAPSGAEESVTLVGSGSLMLGDVRVVDPETRVQCAPGGIGEIWISNACVADGYWQSSESAATFDARLTSGEGPFLRTGDLGFLRDGELFVVGRLKDMLIVHGRNYYANDLEATAEASFPGLRSGCGAAFALEKDGEEQVVIVQEMAESSTERCAEAAEAIRQAITTTHGIPVAAVVLIEPKSIFKTSSGKIRRQDCKKAFLAGTLKVLGELRFDAHEAAPASEAPGTETEQAIAGIWAELLGLRGEQVGSDTDFFSLGGDSVLAAQVVNRIGEQFQVQVRLEDATADFTVRGLARAVDALLLQKLEQMSDAEAEALLARSGGKAQGS